MANIYYHLFDTTKTAKDPSSASFQFRPFNHDLAGAVVAFARHNGVDPSKVRLFCFETKKAWEECRTRWLAGIDWSIPVMA